MTTTHASPGLSVDPVRRREALFEQASEAAYRAVLAIAQDLELEARSAIDELRFLKCLINTGEPHQAGADPLVHVSPLQLQRMRLAFDAIQDSDAVIRPWIQHNLARLQAAGSSQDASAWPYHIDHALPELWNFDSDLFVVHGQPPPELLATLRARGQRRVIVLAPASEATTARASPDLCVSNDGTALAAFVESLSKPYPKAFARLSVLDESNAGDPAVAQDAARAMLEDRIHKAVMHNWMNHNTRRLFAQRWVEQGVANIPAIARHANLHALDDRFRDRPAILIAPGPSLDKNIHLLRQAQGKAVLIAPLQALRPLYKAGIRPDLVTVLDAFDLTTEPFDFFGDVPDAFLSALVVAVNGHPRVIQRFKQVYFYSGNGPLDQWVQDIVSEPLLNLEAPSVTLSAMHLARHWGCSAIALVGHDLALAGQRRYAEDAQLNNLNTPQLMSLPGYHGGTVQSPSDYFLFHHQFELIAAEIGRVSPHTKLFNCTEGGAFVKGFAHEPLQRVLDEHVVGLTLEPVSELLGRPTVATHPDRVGLARGRLQRTLATLADLQRQARQLKRLSQQPHSNAAHLRKLAEREQALRNQLKQVQGFTTIYQDDIDAAVRSAVQAKTLQDNLAASRALYQVVSDGCEHFRPLVQQALLALQPDAAP